MDSYIMRGEHEEFVKRVDEEQHRQNKRIEIMEESLRQMQTLTLSVEKMALSMESMMNEQKKQGDRLEELEGVPKKTVDTFKYGIIGAIAAALGGGLVTIIANFIV